MNTQRMYVSGGSAPQPVAPMPYASTLAEVFPWRTNSIVPAAPSIGDEFALFADEALEWAEITLSAALEDWPDE